MSEADAFPNQRMSDDGIHCRALTAAAALATSGRQEDAAIFREVLHRWRCARRMLELARETIANLRTSADICRAASQGKGETR